MAKERKDYLVIGNALGFSTPFLSYSFREPTVQITVHLDKFVDPYDYHDFPSSHEIYVTEEQIEELRDLCNLVLKEINKLKENNQ